MYEPQESCEYFEIICQQILCMLFLEDGSIILNRPSKAPMTDPPAAHGKHSESNRWVPCKGKESHLWLWLMTEVKMEKITTGQAALSSRIGKNKLKVRWWSMKRWLFYINNQRVGGATSSEPQKEVILWTIATEQFLPFSFVKRSNSIVQIHSLL